MSVRLIMTTAWCLVCLSATAQTGKDSLHLFDDVVKKESPAYVCDFLEHYLYKVSKSQRGYDFYQRLADDKVVIRDGSLDNIQKLSPITPFSLTRYEDKGYNVCWKDTLGRVLLDMQFPIQFELILGKTKAEIEQSIKTDLEDCSSVFLTIIPDSVLKEADNEIFVSANTSHYYLEDLNTASYYWRKSDEVIPVYTSDYKGESAANLFHGYIDGIEDYRLHIEETLYGFKKTSYNIKLGQWLNYCQTNRLTVYFGIEEERKDGLKALLIAQNKDLGYNHVLSIIMPDNFVKKRNSVFKVTLNAYIPTNNVKDLYKQDVLKGEKK